MGKFRNLSKNLGLLLFIYLLVSCIRSSKSLFKKTKVFSRGLRWLRYLCRTFFLLAWTHYDYCQNRDKSRQNFKRKFYFIYAIFAILYLVLRIGKYDIWQNSSVTIFNLNTKIASSIVLGIISYIIYLLVISDFNISEISFAGTKISLLREQYSEELNNQFEHTEQLRKKIENASLLIENMKERCSNLLKDNSIEDINIHEQYKKLLKEYFSTQEENVEVYVLEGLNLRQLIDIGFEEKEVNIIEYQLRRHKEEVYAFGYLLYLTKIHITSKIL